jgi:hypothetical protein
MSYLRPLQRRPAPQPRAVVETPKPPDNGGAVTRILGDACTLVEAELDSASIACRRQSTQAAARSARMRDESAAIAAVAREAARVASDASENVAAVAAASEELSAAGREIGAQAARSTGIARQAVGTSDEAATAMAELGRAVASVGEVVRAIADIAARTNLLALNATIEAARAGDAGRGFAVVAGEVKELSRQTAAATQDISKRIRAIQSATDSSVAVMRDVAGAVREMDAANAAVAAAIEQQEATLRTIAGRLQGASTNTEKVATAVSEMAERGGRLGILAADAHGAAAQTDAQIEDLRGNVALVLHRVASLGDSWNKLVPLQAPGRLSLPGWSGDVTVLELSEQAALVRLAPEGGASLQASSGERLRLELPQTGVLDGTLEAFAAGRALIRLNEAQQVAQDTLSRFVASVRAADTYFVDAATAAAARASAALERAVQAGELTESAIFDTRYTPVPGSDPAQYITEFTPAADRLLRPILDDLLDFDKAVVGAFAVDRNGYAPTHNTNVSQTQRADDPTFNARYCRNRRLFDDRAGLSAGRMTGAHLLQSYERDMGGGQRMMIKEADAPITVGGRGWGALRLMYRKDEK